MSGSVNRVIIMGALGRDPEIKAFAGGGKVANMSVACSEKRTDKRTGEKIERTEWVRIAVFNVHLVGVVERYVKKGTTIHVTGELRTREWTDRGGEKRHTTEVVLPQYGGELVIVSQPKGERSDAGGYGQRQPTGTDQRGNPQYDDSEIPF